MHPAAAATRRAAIVGGAAVRRRYRIVYRDVHDHDNQHSAIWYGMNREHAALRFYDAPDAEGWEIVTIEPAPKREKPAL